MGLLERRFSVGIGLALACSVGCGEFPPAVRDEPATVEVTPPTKASVTEGSSSVNTVAAAEPETAIAAPSTWRPPLPVLELERLTDEQLKRAQACADDGGEALLGKLGRNYGRRGWSRPTDVQLRAACKGGLR